MSSFEVGKSYRVLPEFYDKFDFCCDYWDGKDRNHVFTVDELSSRNFIAMNRGSFVACFEEFKYCQEVLESPDYSKCLYNYPEYLCYYVSFKYYDQIKYCYIDKPEIKHDGKLLKFSCSNDGEKWWVYLEDLTFYREDGTPCKHEDLLPCSFDELT